MNTRDNARGDQITVTPSGWAHGGTAVGRLNDGRAVFVDGAIPGETVVATLDRVKKRYSTATVTAIIVPSPDRVAPPCPYVDQCGGCQLQHIAPKRQRALKRRVVVEQLQRLAKIDDPPVSNKVIAPAHDQYRDWARMAVDDSGRLGFRRRRSNAVTPIDRCLLFSAALQHVRDKAGDEWRGASEVTLAVTEDDRGGVATAIGSGRISGTRNGLGVTVVQPSGRRTSLGDPAPITITVDGVLLTAEPDAFFQSGVPAATALVRTVLGQLPEGATIADLYAGVGLFAAACEHHGFDVRSVVEANPLATVHAERNCSAPVRTCTVEEALADGAVPPVDVIIVDPPRAGAGIETTKAIADLDSPMIIYVACDPAALARDVAVLRHSGYTVEHVEVIDAFAHTTHVESVCVLTKRSGLGTAKP